MAEYKVTKMKASLVLICAVILSVFATAALADDGMGVVVTADGAAHVRRGNSKVVLAPGDRVFVSDIVTTAPDSKLQILLDDESSITIGPDSSVALIEFSNDEDDANFVSHISEGRMRVVTGRATERDPDEFRTTTRHAAMGIRSVTVDNPAEREAAVGARGVNPEDVYAKYAIKVKNGGDIPWKPTAVYDAMGRTHIVMPELMQATESPVFFINEDGSEKLTNYRVEGNLYIVDRLFDIGILQVGGDRVAICRDAKVADSAN